MAISFKIQIKKKEIVNSLILLLYLKQLRNQNIRKKAIYQTNILQIKERINNSTKLYEEGNKHNMKKNK
jgi:hypothetical protein